MDMNIYKYKLKEFLLKLYSQSEELIFCIINAFFREKLFFFNH